ncbi:uncharacterized protein ACMZJ9_017921 isoform 1-T2 [Mantella aurantiaca]
MASCIVMGCTGNWNNPDSILHEFPKNIVSIKCWLQQTGQDFGDLDAFSLNVLFTQAYRMCSLHFTPDCYIHIDGSERVLKENAVPTIFGRPSCPAPPSSNFVTIQIKEEECPMSLSPPSPAGSGTSFSGRYTSPPMPASIHDEQQESDDTDSISSHDQEMMTPKCFVIGCPNGAEDQPLYPGVTLHKFPTDLTRVKAWLRQSGHHLGNPDLFARHVLSNWANFRMCSSHFGPDSYFIRGSVVDLKPNAVPTIFPKLETPTIKEEEQREEFQPICALEIGCNTSFMYKQEIDECIDEQRRVRHVGTTTDPYWGMRSVGVLTRPLLMKEASTCTSVSRFGKTSKIIKLQRMTAEKGVQCSTFDMSFDGDKRSARPDYFYQANPFLAPGEMGFDKPLFNVTPPWREEHGLNGANQDYMGSTKGVPVKDSRLFLALEEVLISLMQHMVSSSFIEENDKLTTQRILSQTLEIISLLTGDKWVIGEKEEDIENVDEVPVKCGDVGVYFSPDEWDYIEAHKEMYLDVIPEDHLLTESQQDFASGDESASEEEAKPSPDRASSPEWKPQSDHSEFSESELSTEDADDSDDTKKRKTEDAFLGNPEIKIEYSADGKTRTFWCLRCNISLKDRRCFRSHLKTQRHLNFRADEEVVTCEECSQVFSTRSALIKHKAENHANKRYACNICGLEYDYISQFIIHQRAHTGEKPFECDKCGKRFGHKCTLLVHHRRHMKGKTVKCSKCDRLFDTKSQLSRHERIHVPKKPYICPVCGKKFEQKSQFTKHKWEHEEEAKREPEVIQPKHEEAAKQDTKVIQQTQESVASNSPPSDISQEA